MSVVGPTCGIDLLGEERRLPALRRGDLLAVLDVGGYAEVLSTQFNLLPRPATVLVDGEACDVIRRRETLDDLLATQAVPARLEIVDNRVMIDNLAAGRPGIVPRSRA